MTIKKKALLLFAPVVLGLGALTACSGADGASAPQSNQTQSNQTQSNQTQYTDIESWQLAMNKCMSDKGMAPQMQQLPGGGTLLAAPNGVDPAAYDQAGQDCVKQIGEAPVEAPSPEEQQKVEAAKLAFYKCLRDAGYDVPTPDSRPGGASATGDLSGIPTDVVTTCSKESGY